MEPPPDDGRSEVDSGDRGRNPVVSKPSEPANNAEAAITGDPFGPGAAFCSLISEDHMAKEQGLLSQLSGRARVAGGGHRLDRPGCFLRATWAQALSRTPRLPGGVLRSRHHRAVVRIRGRGPGPVPALANAVVQGLTASVRSADHGRADLLCRRLDLCAVSVNAHAAMTAEIPYVGFSGTGQGKDLSLSGFEDDTRIKHVASSQWPVTRDHRMNRGGS